ncbi:oxidoreductase [Brevibacillus ginsengisoli]|uniref:oxidoreductase n=1 Tax=Brevibacillus ginsengisoli TaxID=363854 RepID=UPI003CEEBBD2
MTIQVGIIGYGLSGSIFHAPIISRVKELQLRGVVSSNPSKVHQDYPEALVYADVDSLLQDKEINLVIVTSPNTTHFEYAKQAILAKKHVVVEKPFTITSQEADDLISLAQEHQVLLTVYQNRRWDHDFLTVRKLLDTGVLGNLSVFESHFDRFRPVVQNRWREQDLPGSGLLYDLGSHLIDQALLLFGMPQTIWADLRSERQGSPTTDYFHLVLGYENMRVILHSGSLVREKGPRFAIHGDQGSFIKYGLDTQEEQLRQGKKPGDPGWGVDREENYGQLTAEIGGLVMKSTVETITGCYEAFYEDVAKAIQSGESASVKPEEARNTIRLIEYAILSHKEQRTIHI